MESQEFSIENSASSIQHSILVLSDGKPGHYNQSLGIIDRMGDVSAKTVEVRFKRKWRDNALRVFTRLLAGVKLPRKLIRAMLKWSMESSCATAVLGAGNWDAILATGSSVAAPNLLLGQLTGARTAVCTRPSPVGISHFDLALLPEHMRPRRRASNVVMTLGVPNRITPEHIEKAGIALAERLEIADQRVIGLLLGGDDGHYAIPPDMVSSLCDVLLDVCEKSKMCLALTTSRRTDPKSEGVVKSRMNGNPACCFSVLASEPQEENPVPGILGISEVVIVTEDSFSMVCEAASSGKKIIILEVKRKKHGDPKRQRVFEMIVDGGYARSADVPGLGSVILDFADDPLKPKAMNDAQTAADALHSLISGC
ncbi:mitochondrial fission ELM1 family protein [Candidatus Poribacteria bacterium]